jgi:hypothetical protein
VIRTVGRWFNAVGHAMWLWWWFVRMCAYYTLCCVLLWFEMMWVFARRGVVVWWAQVKVMWHGTRQPPHEDQGITGWLE